MPGRVLLISLLAAGSSFGFLIWELGWLGGPPSGLDYFIVAFGILFLGYCAFVGLARIVMLRGAVLTFSPDGLIDRRLSKTLVPWSAIRSLGTWQYGWGQPKFMVVELTPEFKARMESTLVDKWKGMSGRAVGADRVSVSALGLDIEYDRMLNTAQAYLEAYGPQSPNHTSKHD